MDWTSDSPLSSPPPTPSTARQTSPQTPTRPCVVAPSSPSSSAPTLSPPVRTPGSDDSDSSGGSDGDSNSEGEGDSSDSSRKGREVEDDDSKSSDEDMLDCNDDDSISSNFNTSAATPRRTRGDKLQAVVSTLRRLDWSFEDLIHAWVGLDNEDVTIRHQRYGTQRKIFKVAKQVEAHGIAPAADPRVKCRKELDKLYTLPSFGKFSFEMSLDDIDFASGIDLIRSTAPTWFEFMRQLLGNRRQQRPSYPTYDNWTAAERRLFTITCMVCF
jgi:hypothetical protein